MAAFVGFDPLKSHRSHILRFASLGVALLGASLIAFARLSA
jgi:hypothetical protein